MKRILMAGIVAFLLSINLLAGPTPDEDVSKARLLLGNDRWVQLHYFLQAGVQSASTWDEDLGETKDDAYWSKDFFVKKSRIILNGQVAENVFFFFQSDDLKVGDSVQNGETEDDSIFGRNSMFTKDAYIHVMPDNLFQIYAGYMALPFSRKNLQQEATALGTDMDNDFVPLNNYSDDGRDLGFMLRGMANLSEKSAFEYRFGFFRGLDRREDENGQIINEDDNPRMTGRIQFHIMEKEDGFFYSENYLGKRRLFAIGAGIDYQKDVYYTDGSFEDYMAYTFDISIDQPVGIGNAVTFQGAFFKGENNPMEGRTFDDTGTLAGSTLHYSKYFAYYLQAGFLVADTVQPYVKYLYRRNKNVDGGGNVTYKTVDVGLNYLFNGHSANVRLEGSYPLAKNEDFADEKKVTLQFQIYL